VCIFVGDGCWAGVAILIKELLAIAGTLHARNADLRKASLFQVSLLAAREGKVRSFTGIDVAVELGLEDTARRLPAPDVVIIPPFFFPQMQACGLPPAFLRWLRRAYDKGAILFGLDGGVRLLAESGLLDGHEVTGNLSDRQVFASRFPDVRFSPQVPLIIDGRIISATGTAPSMDACAYLVSHFYGEAAAHKFTRYTNPAHSSEYERTELSNAAWKNHADGRIKQAQEFIERHFSQDISVEDAARRASMSLRNFSRRFHLAVGMSAQHFIAHCRVEHAKKLLERNTGPLLQIALESGFNNEASLRRAFHMSLGQSPLQYRKQLPPSNTAAS
jgi:AraC family transcriptional activator FtrA